MPKKSPAAKAAKKSPAAKAAKKSPAAKAAKKSPAAKAAKKSPAAKAAKKSPATKAQEDQQEVEEPPPLEEESDDSYEDEDAEEVLKKIGDAIAYHDFESRAGEPRRVCHMAKPSDRKTSRMMTQSEMTEVISIRAKQIEDGGVVFVDIGDIDDPRAMAAMEIRERRCPLSVIRMHNDTHGEIWDVNELVPPTIQSPP